MIEIIGIGNDLFGDDGFGPMVVDYINNNYDLGPGIDVVNAGSAPDFLFNEFLETDTKQIIIIDVFDTGKRPGEVDVINIKDLPAVFPQRLTHGMPVAAIMKQISDMRGIKIDIITCQPERITVPDVCVGLSKAVSAAVPKAAALAVKLTSQDN